MVEHYGLSIDTQVPDNAGSRNSVDTGALLAGTRISFTKPGTIKCMLCRLHLRVFVISAALLMIASVALSAQSTTRRGRKYKAPPPTSRIEVSIVRDTDSKPIENAAVIFHLDGDKGNMELKTNEDGKTMIDVLPLGSTMRLQVIAKGYKTYGEDFEIDKPELSFDVRMKRPGEQYSIYKKHDQAVDSSKPPVKSSPDDKGAKESPKDKPAESANENSGQSTSGRPQPQ